MSKPRFKSDAEVLHEIDVALENYRHSRALGKTTKNERGLFCQIGKQVINGKTYYYQTRYIDLADPRNQIDE